MNSDDKDIMNRMFELASNYAGVYQGLRDLVSRLDSYSYDIKQHKEMSATRDKEILDRINQLDKDTIKQIQRFVDGMNKKIDESKQYSVDYSLKLERRIDDLEGDRKGVKWVVVVLLGLISAAWAFIVKNWQNITN